MKNITTDQSATAYLKELAKDNGLDIQGGKVRRSSSRFCFGVEHGDYNGTELFGVGTDRFIWTGYKPNGTGKMRYYSGNFPEEGVIEFEASDVPKPGDKSVYDSWARFACGADYILRREGYELKEGMDAVIYGNIPGGGMSRSASLSLNLIITILEINGIEENDRMRIVDLAQMVETDYIGSPCGKLDQIMIMFAKEGFGTHYRPADRSIEYVKLGDNAEDFRIVVMDTGTERPGLEKSTYKVRRQQCDELVEKARQAGFDISCLGDVGKGDLYEKISTQLRGRDDDLLKLMDYIYHAQERFYLMLEAWKNGNIQKVGGNFRRDGIGLRDDYRISGKELETMCDIVRTVEGVYGERMLGGGDKGAAGCIVRADSVEQVRQAVDTAYPRSHPELAGKYAVHSCGIVDGIKVLDDVL